MEKGRKSLELLSQFPKKSERKVRNKNKPIGFLSRFIPEWEQDTGRFLFERITDWKEAWHHG